MAGNVDISARTIDLVNTLATITTKDGVVPSLLEVGEWLGRERVNRYSLQLCLEKARGLVIPNPSGQEFFESIGQQVGFGASIRPLFLKQSGSLGHLIARDPYLRWMVSTVACLFQFQNRESQVSDTLCDFIIQVRGLMSLDKDEPGESPAVTRFHPARIEIKAVLDKIVSSIWLNIVNSGLHEIPLRPELKDVCPRSHLVDSFQFAKIANTLRQNHSHVVILSRHLLHNITLWLFKHFDGRLQITVSGKIVIDEVLGESPCNLDLRVDTFCSLEGPCVEGDTHMTVLANISGRLEQIFHGRYPESRILKPQPGTPQQLYTQPTLYSKYELVRLKEIQLDIQSTAWKMSQWLFGLRVGPPAATWHKLAFPVTFHGPPTSGQPTFPLSSLLYRIPGIINLDWSLDGKDEIESNFFGGALLERIRQGTFGHSPEPTGSSASDTDWLGIDRSENVGMSGAHSLGSIARHFPLLGKLLKKLARRCLCHLCRACFNNELDGSSRRLTDRHLSRLTDGCLKTEGLTRVFKLIAHAVADSLGCSKVSGSTQTSGVIDGIRILFYELIEHHQIVWDTWFSLAAAVTLGCPFRHHQDEDFEQGRAFAAIQYGGLSLVAPWLDMSKELMVHHCFHVIEGHGVIGSVARGEDGVEHFGGVQESFAILQTERTQDNSTYLARHADVWENCRMEAPGRIDNDTSIVDSHVFLLPVKDGIYRLMLRVRSSTHNRIINPADVLLSLASIPRNRKCPHRLRQDAPGTIDTTEDGLTAYVYSFDELLGLWLGRARRGGASTGDMSPTSYDSGDDSDDSDYDTYQRRASGLPKGPDARLSTPPPIPLGSESQELHLTMLMNNPLKINTSLALSVTHQTIMTDNPPCIKCVQKHGTLHVINTTTLPGKARRTIAET